jgi:hypothetical protein
MGKVCGTQEEEEEEEEGKEYIYIYMLAGNLKERDNSKDLGEDQNILKWITDMIGVCGLG